MTPRVVVVGAGMGGLAAAADLARRGCEVIVVDKADGPGGKMREVTVGNAPVAAGPTVFTMRWVFEALFEDAGARLDDHLALDKAELLARHAWTDGGRLDLFADIEASADAIGAFAGAENARGYRDFCARSRQIYETLVGPFMSSQRPSPIALISRVGAMGLGDLMRTVPFMTMWAALSEHFSDPRLRQLFGRYTTYCGASPFRAPATLMLVAHVEQDGVWLVRGGIRRVAEAMRALGEAQGATFRFGTAVSEITVSGGRTTGVVLADGVRLAADAVVFNGDVSAPGLGLLGPSAQSATRPTEPDKRSLSAVTWCLNAPTRGFPLAHHNVFFGDDYEDEFDAIFARRAITDRPTVYVCAQDRGGVDGPPADAPERMLVLINAPADGDRTGLTADRLADLDRRAFGLMAACGLEIERAADTEVVTTPEAFNELFPGSGGALYGRASHGAMASFQRPGAASRLPGLYLAGGSGHPGPGIPMSTMSGRLAAERLLQDLAVR